MVRYFVWRSLWRRFVVEHLVSVATPVNARAPALPPQFPGTTAMQALSINVGDILSDYSIYAMFHDLLKEAGEMYAGPRHECAAYSTAERMPLNVFAGDTIRAL